MLLRAPRAGPDRAPADRRHDLERAVVRRPQLGRDLVLDGLAPLGEALLQRRLEVDRVRQRVLDLGRERLDDGLGRPLVAGLEVAGPDHRPDDRREHPLGARQGRRALPHARRRRRRQALRHAEPFRDRAARGPGHGLRADLREPPGAVALGLEPRVEVRGDRQAEDAVAEEGEARVRVAAAVRPRRVREDLLAQVFGKLVEQLSQAFQLRARGRVVDDEVDGLAHGRDPRGLRVGHLHAVGVLELLYERVEVERVGLEVLPEARGVVDARGIDLELVGEVRLDEREDLFAGHWAGTVEAAADGSPPRRSACAAWSAAWVRPTTSSSVARAASRIACAMPRREKRPWGTTPRRRRPSRYAPPALSGSMTSRNSSSAGRSSIPPAFARGEDSATRRMLRSIASETPSMSLSTMLPVKPSVTITSARPVGISLPSTLPAYSYVPPSAIRSRMAAWVSTTSGVPFVASSPIDRSPIRGRSTPSSVSASAPPMKPNWTRCSGRTSVFAPTSTMITGCSGTGTGIASAGRWMPRARRMLKSAAASAGPVEPPETNASASPSATARAARTIEDSGAARTATTGSAAFAIDTGASTISTPSGASPISSAGPNRRTRTPPAAASAAPAATSAGPRSAPLASTATVMLIGRRLLSPADRPPCAPD